MSDFATLPKDAKLFALKAGLKEPATAHAHHDAVPRDEFAGLFVEGNYGIALDGMFAVVDVDKPSPEAQAFVDRLPATWSQQARRGRHYLFRTPDGWRGTNTKFVGGDIKCNGYIVGPGSVVEGHTYAPIVTNEQTRALDPIAPAPEWLLELLTAREGIVELEGIEREQMLDGERDNELTSFAGFMRHKGYGAQAIANMLAGIVNSGVVEQPPGREITARDVTRIAKSVAKKPAGAGSGGVPAISAAEWLCGTDVPLVGPPVRWWVRGFVPHDVLVMLFGAGGVGKSSFGSWLAAEVTQKGGSFLYIGVEEPFERFLARAVLAGADRSKIFSIPQASRFSLPRDVQRLREQVEMAKISVTYFDSVYSHFDAVQGENVAERARKCLGPLAEMAQETHTTIVGVFHENKEGDYLGSVEMVNVARYVLHASRIVTDENAPLVVKVHKHNIWDPGFALTFDAPEHVLCDPATGEIQMEEQTDGTLTEMKIRVPVKGKDRNTMGVLSKELGATETEIEEAKNEEPA